MSRRPSYDCSNQPVSGSQKMSIGIVGDPAVFRRRKESGLNNGNAGTEKEAGGGTQRLTLERSVDQGVVAPDGNLGIKLPDKSKKRASSIATTSSLRGVQPAHSVQTGRGQGLLQHGVGRKRGAESGSQMDGKRVGRTEKMSSGLNQVDVPAKEVPQEQPTDMETGRQETLRMKLRQILGTNTSANEKVDDAKSFEGSTHEIMQEKNPKTDPPSKPRQNSDSIETDSENAGGTTMRPVTRSRGTKKAPARKLIRSLKPKSLSSDRVTKQGISKFSCAEKSVPSQSCKVNRGYLMEERIDGVKRSCGIKPGDTLLPKTDLKNIQSVMTGEQSSPVKELPSHSVARSPPAHGCLNDNIEVTLQNVDPHHFPVVSEKHQLQVSEDQVLHEKSEHHGSFGFQNPSPKDDGPDSPLFSLRKNILDTPLGLFSVNNNQKQHVQGSPNAADRPTLEDKCLTMSSPATENSSDSSDATATPDDRHAKAQESSSEEKDAENGVFTPARGGSDSSEEDSPMKKAYLDDVQTSLESQLIEKPMSFRKKRRCSQDVDFDDISPAFALPRAGGKMDDILMDASEGNADDGLARVIPLLALALERVKNKMTLVTSRKCSDILMSAAEDIHSQLQDVESQIQTDLGKLASLKTSKRKQLETKLQEQQEHLKVIHEKFKEEIHKYLQNCRGAVEGLETEHTELKGVIERQKASHRKLVSQAEAAVENHLVDTRRKVKSVHKLGNQKMQQLKVAIGECLKDVIMS